MKHRSRLFAWIATLTLAIGGIGWAQSAYYYTPGTEIVLTDPLVRSFQIGAVPVGVVTAANPATGVGVVAVPGIGARAVRLVGVPVSWSGRPALRAVDLETGLEFVALLPDQPRLVPATVVRATGDMILVRRQTNGMTFLEALPVGSVFATSQGRITPPTRVSGALRSGAQVLIPPEGGARGRMIVRQAAAQ